MEDKTKDQIDQINYIKGVIEALLFVNEHPITLEQIKRVLETVSPIEIKNAIKLLQKDYEDRNSGINIVEIAEGYQMLSNPTYAEYIRNFYKTKHKEKLSKPALESLAIVAYKQPVTRMDVEMVRGVNSDGVISHLLEKELIKIVGRKEVPGRPYLFGTTKQFLEYFGLKSLETLPKLEEFPALKALNDNTQVQVGGNFNEEITLEQGKVRNDSQIDGKINDLNNSQDQNNPEIVRETNEAQEIIMNEQQQKNLKDSSVVEYASEFIKEEGKDNESSEPAQ